MLNNTLKGCRDYAMVGSILYNIAFGMHSLAFHMTLWYHDVYDSLKQKLDFKQLLASPRVY